MHFPVDPGRLADTFSGHVISVFGVADGSAATERADVLRRRAREITLDL